MPQPLYLSLGSNLGDRRSNLRRAIDALRTELSVRALSSIYETDPVGVLDQPRFLNAAVAGLTDLPAREILSLAKRIEREVGRKPSVRWGPREVDIDILLYGELVLDDPELVIPHPELANRAFVLVPLAEIAAEMVHPLLGLSVAEMLEQVPGRESVRLLGPFQ